jgi:phosphocarrier protein HPr
MTEAVLTIINKNGLHARPAKDLLKKAREFKSKITIQNLSRPESQAVVLTPINLLNAAIRKGEQIRLTAEGEDELAAIDALSELISQGFGEEA